MSFIKQILLRIGTGFLYGAGFSVAVVIICSVSFSYFFGNLKETRKELELLKTSAQTIEKYARENYYMKKDNEDLFIVNTTIKK